MVLSGKAFEKIERKGENADQQHFLPFSTIFSSLPKTNITILAVSYLLPAQ